VLKGKTPDGRGMIINSSRGIIYAGKGKDFAQDARAAASQLREEINRHR
jgi:orotidine-5'-phosphate decarboxylase